MKFAKRYKKTYFLLNFEGINKKTMNFWDNKQNKKNFWDDKLKKMSFCDVFREKFKKIVSHSLIHVSDNEFLSIMTQRNEGRILSVESWLIRRL